MALAGAVCLGLMLSLPAAGESDCVRVLLTRFGTVSELEVQFSGSYSCGDAWMQRGMSVRLAAGPGRQVRLKYEGLTLVTDGPLVLVRHRTEGENGLRLQGGLNLYTGDLRVVNSDGALRLVLYVPLEEYLLGVLPWEMSSGFPLEALKAQAVAARTYALTHLHPERDYDVTDNTNDQVYAGIGNDAAVIRTAVRETSGICVYYQGKLVPCYYTASNGGLTETIERVWGASAGASGYTVVKRDPYDLENDESVVRQATLPKKPGGDDWPGLMALLRQAAGPALKRLGYSDDPEQIRVREIADITADGGENEAPKTLSFSLYLDALRLDDGEEEILFAGSQAAPTEPPAASPGLYSLQSPVTVQVAIFPELEQALGLSINKAANEVWQVRAGRDAFTVEARRYGHGVGMSQRGAQRMAARYGWDYKQILHFYYEGVILRRAALTAVTLAPAFEGTFDATPGPKPTATPRPTLMPLTLKPEADEGEAVVDRIDTDSTLNLRARPDTSSEIVTRLYYGQRLAVLEAADGWLHVRTDAVEGYVMEKFVTRTETEASKSDE